MASDAELIYEGKAKKLYKGQQAGTLVQYFKDDARHLTHRKRTPSPVKDSEQSD